MRAAGRPPKREQRFHRGGDVAPRQTILAMPAARLADHEPRLAQARKMAAGRWRRDIGAQRQLTRRSRASVEQLQKHRGPRRIAEQVGQSGDGGRGIHGSSLHET